MRQFLRRSSEFIDRFQHQTEKAAGRQRVCSASLKPNSLLPPIFCFVHVLPSSTLPCPPAAAQPPPPPPPSLSAMTTQKADEIGRGERKREHLVCRALISIALGEQVLPIFPHKKITHKHTSTYSVTNTLSDGWPLASTSLRVEKRGCVVRTTA